MNLRSISAMPNTQKMLLEGWQPRRVCPTTIDGRAMVSGICGQRWRISCSMVDLERVYSTRCSASSSNSPLSATSEPGSGEQDMAVPTCRKRFNPGTCAILSAKARVPSTFTFQMSGLLPNEATAAQLITCVTLLIRASVKKSAGSERSPNNIFSIVILDSRFASILNFSIFARIRARPCCASSARTSKR